jgi:hypothetical protein
LNTTGAAHLAGGDRRRDPLKQKGLTSLEMVFCYQNCSSDREKLLKLEAEGQEFATFLRSLEQFIQTVKGQKKFW